MTPTTDSNLTLLFHTTTQLSDQYHAANEDHLWQMPTALDPDQIQSVNKERIKELGKIYSNLDTVKNELRQIQESTRSLADAEPIRKIQVMVNELSFFLRDEMGEFENSELIKIIQCTKKAKHILSRLIDKNNESGSAPENELDFLRNNLNRLLNFSRTFRVSSTDRQQNIILGLIQEVDQLQRSHQRGHVHFQA